jgi:hypothetical protein
VKLSSLRHLVRRLRRSGRTPPLIVPSYAGCSLDNSSGPSLPSSHTDYQPERRVRRFVGRDGREWRVREIPAPSYDRRSGYCLVFETAGLARRVRNYATTWYNLTDDELDFLGEQTPAR